MEVAGSTPGAEGPGSEARTCGQLSVSKIRERRATYMAKGRGRLNPRTALCSAGNCKLASEPGQQAQHLPWSGRDRAIKPHNDRADRSAAAQRGAQIRGKQPVACPDRQGRERPQGDLDHPAVWDRASPQTGPGDRPEPGQSETSLTQKIVSRTQTERQPQNHRSPSPEILEVQHAIRPQTNMFDQSTQSPQDKSGTPTQPEAVQRSPQSAARSQQGDILVEVRTHGGAQRRYPAARRTGRRVLSLH